MPIALSVVAAEGGDDARVSLLDAAACIALRRWLSGNNYEW